MRIKKIINFLKSRIKYKKNEKCLSGNGTFTVGNNGRLFYFFINNNMIVSQKKFYPNPKINPKEVIDIIKLGNVVYKQSLKPFFKNLIKLNNNITSKFENDREIEHSQEILSMFNVEHNKEEFSISYDLQKDEYVSTKNNIEIVKNLDEKIKKDSFIIEKKIESIVFLSEDQKKIITRGLKEFDNCNNKIKYIQTIGIQKNNLTTGFTNNKNLLIHNDSKKNIIISMYMKKGIININRNDEDYVRSIIDIIIGYNDNKGLQKYNISEENHQKMSLEILNKIGGYENVQYYNEMKTKEQAIKILVCAWIYLQNKQ